MPGKGKGRPTQSLGLMSREAKYKDLGSIEGEDKRVEYKDLGLMNLWRGLSMGRDSGGGLANRTGFTRGFPNWN